MDSSDRSQDGYAVEDILLTELDRGSITSFRNRMKAHRPDHPWADFQEEEFLRMIGAARYGNDNKLHPTAAGLLMFGNEVSISQEFPNYHLDYLEYLEGAEWSDRFCSGTGTWSGNLYDFYTEVMRRLDLGAKRPFRLEGAKRIDDTDLLKAERELVSNGLIHADYHGRGGIRIELHVDMFSVRNPGTFRIPFGDAQNGGMSDPRNPGLMKMFMLIGAVENAGSGIRRIFDTCRNMGLEFPRFEEKVNPITMLAEIIFLPIDHDWDIETKIKRMMIDDSTITMDSISGKLGVSRSTVYRAIEVLKSRNEVIRVGGKRGRWEVTGYQ